MQSIENKTHLVGTILSRERHPTLPDFDLVNVRVEDAKPVEGKADLLSSALGGELAVTLRRALLDESARPGASIRFEAQRTPDGAMADTYPLEDTFSVEPGPELAPSPAPSPTPSPARGPTTGAGSGQEGLQGTGHPGDLGVGHRREERQG